MAVSTSFEFGLTPFFMVLFNLTPPFFFGWDTRELQVHFLSGQQGSTTQAKACAWWEYCKKLFL